MRWMKAMAGLSAAALSLTISMAAGAATVAHQPTATAPGITPAQRQHRTAATMPASNVEIIHRSTRSLRGLSRDHWYWQTVLPVRGQTVHRPAYFHAIRGMDGPSPVLAPADVQQRLKNALSGNHRAPWGAHAAELVWEPARFFGDVLLLPAYMIVQPPWSDVESP